MPESVQAFAGRVDQLLAKYEQAAGDRLTVVRCNTSSNFSAGRGAGRRHHSFQHGQGRELFPGNCGGVRRSKGNSPALAPEWERALEPDLTRAIARAAEAKAGVQSVARADTATLDAVEASIPDLNAVSLEEGTKLLRDAGRTQFKQAVEEMEAKVKEAQERYIQAQGNQSEAAQQTALEQLRKIQAEGMDKLKQIALNSHAQIAALQQLKKTAP